jgi:hypothetical protein
MEATNKLTQAQTNVLVSLFISPTRQGYFANGSPDWVEAVPQLLAQGLLTGTAEKPALSAEASTVVRDLLAAEDARLNADPEYTAYRQEEEDAACEYHSARRGWGLS